MCIRDRFRGSVDEFLAYSPLTLADSLKDKLDRQFQRLAELEKKVITLIVKESSPISLRHLSNNLSVSPSELLNIIDSLKRRILLELKQQNQETILLVNPVLKAMISINEVQQLVRH